MLIISPHMHSIWMPLILDYLPSIGSCLESDCPAKKVVKTSNGGNLHILLILIPVSYLSTSLRSIPPLIWDHQSVSYWSDTGSLWHAICNSWFWSASRTCPIDSSTVLWICLKITLDLRGIEPTPGFSPGFRFKFDSPNENTCSSLKLKYEYTNEQGGKFYFINHHSLIHYDILAIIFQVVCTRRKSLLLWK